MNDPAEILDELTKLLAYVGDEGAKDGYFLHTNNDSNPVYSVPIRNHPLTNDEMGNLINNVKRLLENDTPLDNSIPNDVVYKVNNLKVIFNESSNDGKDGVIEYLNNYEANLMQGGRRKRNNRKSKRTVKKRRNNRKSRRNNRK